MYEESDFDAFGSHEASRPSNLVPCSNCGRNFNSQALERHEPICLKSSQKKRKVFNAAKQRAEGTDITTVKKTSSMAKTTSRQQPQQQSPPKSNWRAKHEDFINTIRAARGVQKAMESGAPLPPPPPPSINPDYIQCPYCSRRFNQTAAERHINFCKEQHARLPTKKPDAHASAKYNARKQYIAPRPAKKTTSSTSSAISSHSGNTKANLSRNNNAVRNPNSGNLATASGRSNNAYSASKYADSDSDTPSSGRALRTGRTQEMYSEARQLSAKQRSNMPRQTPTKNTYNNSYGNSYTATTAAHDDGFYPSYDGSDSGGTFGGGVIGTSTSSHRPARYNHRTPTTNTGSGRVGAHGGSAANSRFCHECGTKYPVTTAKFCCECGMKRVNVH